jgi:hypothetical protein
MYRELLLGCGYRRERLVDPYTWNDNFAITPGDGEPLALNQRWKNVVTLDNNPGCEPDYRMDLSRLDWSMRQQPQKAHESCFAYFPIDSLWRPARGAFDEVHAYEVLEHLGQQGDERAFFAHFENIWRMLKVGGFLCATVPSRFSWWLWGDPGHRRAILPVSLLFLRQQHYVDQLGKGPSSDYRDIYKGNFHIVHSSDNEETHTFVLQALPAAESSL